MGTITDLVSLVNQLNDSVQDRKFAGELREIQRMIGTLQSEHASMHEQRINLMTENAELKQEIANLKTAIVEIENPTQDNGERIPEEAEKMLVFIATSHGRTTREDVVAHSGLSKAKGEYFFDILKNNKFIHTSSGQMGVGWFYNATPAGRAFLVENGLVK